jgi:hypothetical protein
MKMSDSPTLYQVTDWNDPEDLLETSHGTLRFMTWLVTEAKRWALKDSTAVIRADHGKVALFGYGFPAIVEAETFDRTAS